MDDTLLVSVFGKTASIAFVKPVSPSTQAIKISSTPLFLMLFITDVQNFALSFSLSKFICFTHHPHYFTKPVHFDADRYVHSLFDDIVKLAF